MLLLFASRFIGQDHKPKPPVETYKSHGHIIALDVLSNLDGTYPPRLFAATWKLLDG